MIHDMIDASTLSNAISPYDGVVSFPVMAGSVSAPGMEETLSLTYASNVQQEAVTWNLDAPTGVAGLGWSLNLSFIAQLPARSVDESQRRLVMVVRGQRSPLVRTGTASDGALLYASTIFLPWKIRFYANDERWVITTEFGETLTLGDRRSGRQTVGERVIWGNWCGPSGSTSGQGQTTALWMLSERKSQFGQGFDFTYDMTTVPVGDAQGASFMQAVYLSRVTSTTGASLRLTYGDKQVGVEYVVPHSNPAPPNAYQSSYQTIFLEKVESYCRAGTKISSTNLSFDDGSGGTAFLGTATLSKRLLTGLTHRYASGAARPATTFAYWGQTQADGVSVAAPYSATTKGLYGSIKSVLLAEGGTATYTYADIAPQFSARDASVAPPAATAKTPRVAIEADFAAMTWLDASNTSLTAQAQWWEGRWIAATLGTIPCASAGTYADLPFSTSRTVIALFSEPQLHLYRPAPGRPGAWIAPVVGQAPSAIDYYAPAITASEPTSLSTGEDFAGLLGHTSGKLFLYRFDGLAWQEQPEITIGSGAQALATSATDSVLLVASMPTGTRGATISIDLFTNADGAIARHTLIFANRQTRSTAISLVQGEGFAVVRVDTAAGAGGVSDYAIIQWANDYGSLSVKWLDGLAYELTPSIAGCTVAVGRTLATYNGKQWAAFDSDTISYPNQSEVSGFSPGDSVAVRKIKIVDGATTSYVYDLLAFDPNTGQWAVPTGMSMTSPSGDAALAAAKTYDLASNFAVLDNAVFHQAPDASWHNVGTLTVGSAADAATVCLSGSSCVVYQSGTGSGTVNSHVAPLVNGAAATAVDINGQETNVAGKPADYLIGERTLLSYAGDFSATPSSLTVHRLVRGAVTGAQSVYAAAQLSLNSGYQSELYALDFQASHAVAQIGGWTAALQQTTRLSGGTTPADAVIGPQVDQFFNGLTPDESTGLTYPTGAGTNAPTYYGTVRGLRYSGAIYTKAKPATDPAQETTAWWSVTVSQIGDAAVSSFTRAVQRQVVRDGVSNTSVNQHDTNGLLSHVQTERYNAAGDRILNLQALTRWPQIYDPNGTDPAPLLAPIVKTVSSTQNATTGASAAVYNIDITTWSNSWPGGNGAWAPCKTFAALNAAPGTFDHWNDTTPFTPDGNGWRQTSVVLSRTSTGLEQQAGDVDQLQTSRIFDDMGEQVLTDCINCDGSAGDLSYLGFESYETLGPWRWQPSGTLNAHIITSDRNTGERCLAIPSSANGATGPMAVFHPQEQSGTYVFSLWAKLSATVTTGTAKWQIQPYKTSDNSAVGTPLTLDMTQVGPSWTLCQMAINLATIRQQAGLADTVELYLTISGGNSIPSVTCMVDDLRFSPLDAHIVTSVFDPATLQSTASLDDNAQVRRTLYDAFDAPFAAIGPGGRVDQANLVSFSRTLSTSDAFLPDFGNTTAHLSSGASSLYDDFYSSQTGDWAFTDTSQWAVENGTLNYSGTTSTGVGATATFAKQAFTNMAASVEIVSRATATSIAIGNGDLFVRWNAGSTQWELVRLSGANVTVEAVNDAVGVQRRLTLVIVDGYAMAFAEGTQIFSYEYHYPSPIPSDYGKFAIAATGTASFDNVTVFDDPSLVVATQDGLGRALQSLALTGYEAKGPTLGTYPAQSGGTLLDPIGRPTVLRNASQGPLEIAAITQDAPGGGAMPPSLLLASPDDNLYVDGGTPLTVDQYLNAYAGFYDYTQHNFEDSALSRPTAIVLPRSEMASADNYTVSMTYSSAAALPSGSAGPSDPKHYFVESTTRLFAIKSNNTRITTTQARYRDMDGLTLFEETTASDGSVSQKTGYIYDDTGRLVTQQQPNAFDPPTGTTAAIWQKSFQYSFEGWLSQTTDPDSGTSQFLYDRAGRMRFWLTAEGASKTPQQIGYRTYDALSRQIETGYVQDATYDFTGIAAKVDEAKFPQIVASNPTGPLQATGAWTQKRSYDVGANGDIENLIGRLYQDEINNRDVADPDSETYTYDIHGNTTSRTVVANSYAANETVGLTFTHTNRDQIATVTYPDKLDGASNFFAVGYYYDRLGRLASVGLPVPQGGIIDPDNPPTPPESAFSTYGYDDAGRLAAVQLNNVPDLNDPQPPVQRLLAYDDSGRLSQIADRYSTTSLDYDAAGGVDGTRYFTGLVGSVSAQNLAGDLWPCPPDDGQTTQFDYDALGRMTASVSDLGWPYQTRIGDGGFDANGNMLSRTIGTAAQTFTWKETSGARVNNQVSSLDATVSPAASLDFEGIAPTASNSGPWSWGSSNSGASGSHVSTDNPHSGGQCLYLAGGSLGHSERLELISYLDPRGIYSLGGYVRTDSGFDQANGDAHWYLSVKSAGATLLYQQVGAIASSSTWADFGPVSLDLPAVLSALGADGTAVTVALVLSNAKCGADGATGPGLFIDDITLTGTATGPAYNYDDDGRVVGAPARGLHEITYQPVFNRTASIQLGSANGDKLVYGFDSNGNRLTAKRTDAAGANVVSKSLSIRGADNEALFVKSHGPDGDHTTFRVVGLDGLVAYSDGSSWSYALADRLRSTQFVFNDKSAVSADINYQPFGPQAQTSGTVETDTLFTGQTINPSTGLYDFPARLYDPEIGRFFATDPQNQFASPYLYAGNDPANNIDLDGEFSVRATGRYLGIAAAVLGTTAYLSTQLAATRLWEASGADTAFKWAFDDETVRHLSSGELTGVLNLPGVRSVVRSVGRLLFNFSRDEFKAVMGVYPVRGPIMVPWVLMGVYRATQDDINANWGPDGWGNAARHFFWTSRAVRFGGRELSQAIADAHELGRPGTGSAGFYDNVADKINNVLGWRYAEDTDTDLQQIYDSLRDKKYLALSGEGSKLFDPQASQAEADAAFQQIVDSYGRALAHLESRFGETPEFADIERAFLCKAIGWSGNGNCPP